MKMASKWIKRVVWSLGLCALSGLMVGATTVGPQSARVIVKYRSNSSVLSQSSDSGRASVMSVGAGAKITNTRPLAARMFLAQADGLSSEALAKRLSAQADVEYAVPDLRRHIMAVPNDSLYSQQWYLRSGEVSAINMEPAWDITTGSSNVVVAVLDTGVRPDHPDLMGKFVYNGSTLYGYDFITDPRVANDGDGRDADPSDPGDYLSSADVASSFFSSNGCTTVENSSWHGTIVSGIIGAASNNSIGIAGVTWGGEDTAGSGAGQVRRA